MAANPEYGDHLKQRITPLMCGIGPVESAVAVTKALGNIKPDLLVSLGSGGSRTLKQGAVYQASSVSYRDMDASPLGFEKGQTPLIDLPVEIPMAVQIDGIESARLSTGANIVSGADYDEIDADMVDMETFAILRACMAFDVPMIGLRGISDGNEALSKLSDWTQYLHVVDQNLAHAVDLLEAQVGS
ncbi:5'-methylthioadenosine/S-adenosylhomocysteine nucleosidase [Ahrensia kielensis]|uniref:5'-methylthioadenosine/S-adenosylhomocysteine nucleosidase n=1 Tax=Ahrensia kielensis TaxID=76980 RepID=A0ABU9T7P1_9HYPH